MNLIGSLLLCLCIALTGCAESVKEANVVEDATVVYTEEAELLPLVPDKPPTHEEIVQGMLDLIASAQDSCTRMLAEAEAKGSRAVEIAEPARAKHEPRLTKLEGLDYDAMADDAIYEYMAEVSDIITAFREARDAIEELD